MIFTTTYHNAALNGDIAVSALAGRTPAVQPTRASGEQFGSFLEKADKAVRADENQPVQKNGNKPAPKKAVNNSVRTAEPENAGKPNDAAQKTESPETDGAKTENVKPDNVKPEGGQTEDNGEQALEDANAEILAKVSELLGIPESVIADILFKLNLQPIDLTNAENMNTFVQKLFNVESPVELLSVPNVGEIFKQLGTVAEEYAETAAKLANTVSLKATTEQISPEIRATAVTAQGVDEPVVTAGESGSETVVLQDTPETANAPNQGTQGEGSGDSSSHSRNNSQNSNVSLTGDLTAETLAAENSEPEIGFNPAAVINSPAEIQHTANRLEAVRNIDTQDVINQMVQKLKVEVKADTSEIKISLRPEHLGEVSLKITTQNGIVTAQFLAESQRIKEVIEAGFNQLRDALKEQGVEIANLQVSVGSENSEQASLFERERSRGDSGGRVRTVGMSEVEDLLPEVKADPYGNELSDSAIDYRA